jgi:DNA phosphorothioation-dependent restriction protein DptG
MSTETQKPKGHTRANIYFSTRTEHATAKRQAKKAGFRSLSGYIAYLMRKDTLRISKEATA